MTGCRRVSILSEGPEFAVGLFLGAVTACLCFAFVSSQPRLTSTIDGVTRNVATHHQIDKCVQAADKLNSELLPNATVRYACEYR